MDDLVTIIGKCGADALPFSLLGRGEGYVTVKLGEVAVVGVYFSPNRDLTQFGAYLDQLATEIRRHLPGPVLVAGNLNSKSVDWGSSATDARGRVLTECEAELNLLILNRGSTHTCVQYNGGSIIDVTFGPPPVACKVFGGWGMAGSETLSDHRYIRWDVSDPSLGNQPRPNGTGGTPMQPRWALKRLDENAFMAAASAKALKTPEPGPCDVDGEVT